MSLEQNQIDRGRAVLDAQVEAESQIQAIRGDQLLALPDPSFDQVNLWNETVIARGCLTLLAGAPKIGKSRLIMAAALAAVTGGKFLNIPFSRPLRWLWVQAEIRQHYLKAGRIEPAVARLSAGERDLFCQNFYVTDRLDLDLTSRHGFNAVERMVARVAPDVVVIDPILNFSSANENDAQEMKTLLRAASRLMGEPGTPIETQPALVLVHHTKKVDKKTSVADPFELIRGSGAIRGYYDSAILMLPDQSGATALHFETRNQAKVDSFGVKFSDQSQEYEPAPLAISKNESGQFSALAKPDHAANTAYICQRLAQLDAPHFIQAGDFKAELMEHFNCSDRQAGRHLERAIELSQGLILTAGRTRNTIYYHDQNRALVEPNL